ncbi:MAG: endonuclease/exonuclease/phosphatase family protein [Marmoricola sp.]|nr:endonuclease/exonuclease/phosphatase family protein [Marmoricola sp.]
MRVATFNILNGRSPDDDRVDPERVAAAIRELDADVLALQEVDRAQARSEYVDLTAVAAEAMGATDHRFVAALSGSPGATWVAATGDEQPDAAAYGIALLSRHPVTAWQVVRLPAPRTRVPMWFRPRSLPTWVREEPRVAVAAEVVTPEGPLRVVATHLSFVTLWNGHQLRTLLRGLPRVPHPTLLLGDLNMGPARAARITGMTSLARHVTFPAPRPREQLDHVLADRPVPAASRAVRLPLSDHRALVVDLA